MKKIITTAILGLTFLLGGWASARAATLTVWSTGDVNDNICLPSACTLREAINAANSGDTIVFASPLFDTPQAIHLTLGNLIIPVNKTLTISGRGANLTYITANNLNRIFDNRGNLILNGLTLQDGHETTGDGGGIFNGSGRSLTINDCVFFGNSARGSTAHGGGIYNLGTVQITRSTFFTNATSAFTESQGGGIYNLGTLVIESSTFSGNSSISDTLSTPRGGGIYNGGSLLVTNTTITNNTATQGGGIYKGSAPMHIVNTIISGNPGGDLGGSLNLTTSINNYIGGDARLAPLTNNGGTMPTHALLSDSPAINAGSDCVLTANGCGTGNTALPTDQRGAPFQRRNGGAVDIGAIESPSVVFNANSSGAGSLSATIADAAAGDTITFDPTFFNQPRTITGGITINKSLNIVAPGANILTLDANNANRALYIDTGITVVFNGVRIFRGQAFGTDAGGGVLISVNSTLYATGMVVDSCSAPNSLGGAVYNTGTIYLMSSTISNSSARGGGGIFNDGTAYLINSTVSGNQATSDKGAGMYNALGRFSLLLNTTITNNQSNTTAGAGVWNETFSNPSMSVRARNTIIAGNISGNGNPVDYVGGITDFGNNLINNPNPGLAPLSNYGGATPTHALLPSSPALNAGSDCALTANTCGIAHAALTEDQRGTNAPRKIGAAVDIGSFERNITIDQTSLASGINGFAYSQTLTATRATSLAEALLTGENFDLFKTTSSFAPSTFSIVPATGQSLPPGLTLASDGTISGTPTGAGTFTFTVKAADTDTMAGAAQLSITIATVNSPPTISGATVTRQIGSTASNSQIAAVGDVNTGPNSVSVSVTSANPSNDVTVSNIVNSNGNVTADIATGCSAMNTTFTLTASDGNSTTNAALTVNASANSAPVLQYPATAQAAPGSSPDILPIANSDNGPVTYSIFSVSPALPTVPTVDGGGKVSISNANSLGNYLITVRATDSCGLTTDASFTLSVSQPAANTRIVTKIDDTNDGVCDSDCSLREAIATANSGDVIQFASPLFDSPQTITLTNDVFSYSPLIVNKSLTIIGKGANLLTVRRDDTNSLPFRIFSLNAPGIVISGMTITGGKAQTGAEIDGGGLKIDGGTTTLRGVLVENNKAYADGGGIYVNDGANLVLDSSTVRNNSIETVPSEDGNGGGILARPFTTVLVINSQIHDNLITDMRTSNLTRVGGGGGIDAAGTLTLINSTVVQNTVQSIGSSNLPVTGGGVWVRNTGVFNMKNSVIAYNRSYQFSPENVAGEQDLQGNLTNSGGNLVRIRGANTGFVASDLPDAAEAALVLGNNGGTMQTLLPQPGSPLIDHGETCVATANGCGFTHPAITHDIRGILRPVDGDNNGSALFDIGAVEVGTLPPVNFPAVDIIERNGFDSVAPGSIVRFNVIFNQNVSGVDTSDFALTTTGSISGASVTNVSGVGSSYLVSVNVGSGTGTVRLDVSDNDSIKNASNIPLGGAGTGNGSFTTGEFYTVVNQQTADLDITSPDDTISFINGNFPGAPIPTNENVTKAIDNTTGKYLNFTKDGCGFMVTPQRGATILSAVRFYTANDSPERDPASFRIEGFDGSNWVLITEQPLALPVERNTAGQSLTTPGLFSQTVQLPTSLVPPAYQSYRVTFPTLRNSNSANSMQIGEVELLGRVALSPTAANVTVSGRVLTAEGGAVRNARVVLTDSSGNSRTVSTGTFGYYHFDGVAAGQTYVVSVVAKGFIFIPQVLSVTDDVTELNFTAN